MLGPLRKNCNGPSFCPMTANLVTASAQGKVILKAQRRNEHAHSHDEGHTWSKAVQVSAANNNTPQGFRETGQMVSRFFHQWKRRKQQSYSSHKIEK
jgi:hypothetical protein